VRDDIANDLTPATKQDSLLWTLEEISRLVSNSGNPTETLTNIVELIQRRFESDVCSVYLLEPDRSTLVLAATVGLRPESVGRVRMRLSEGLAGLVGEQLRPQVVEDATRHPRFKYFKEAGEDPYHSFLGVPVVDRGLAHNPIALQGVLVVQTIALHQRFCEISTRDPRAGRSEYVGETFVGRRHELPERARHNTGSRSRNRLVAARAARAADQLHLPPDAGVPGIDAHVGRPRCRRPLGATGPVFLRRVRPTRVAADLLRRSGDSRR
jgi:putative methionine-R-sulfoxide reductase with GAF domain